MNLVETEWRALSVSAQIRHLEVEGYVVLPDALALDIEHLDRVGDDIHISAVFEAGSG